VVAQKNIREFIKDYNRRTKTTILLTSHYMNDIEALCRRVVVINHGKKFFDGKLTDVMEKFSVFKMVTVVFGDEGATREKLQGFGELVDFSKHKAVLRVRRDEVPRVSNALLNQFALNDITIEEVPIEEIIGQVFAEGAKPS